MDTEDAIKHMQKTVTDFISHKHAGYPYTQLNLANSACSKDTQ